MSFMSRTSCRPVVAYVRVAILGCPTVQQTCETLGLASSRRQILLEHEDEHEVALAGEVHDVLGDQDPPVRPRGRCDVRIRRGTKAYLRHVNCAEPMLITQKLGGSGRVHPVEQKRDQRSRAWRSSAACRLESAASALPKMRASIASRCAAA